MAVDPPGKLQRRLERLAQLKDALAVDVRASGVQAPLTDERLREIAAGLKRLERGSR